MGEVEQVGPMKALVLDAMRRGASNGEAARIAGVSGMTAGRWRVAAGIQVSTPRPPPALSEERLHLLRDPTWTNAEIARRFRITPEAVRRWRTLAPDLVRRCACGAELHGTEKHCASCHSVAEIVRSHSFDSGRLTADLSQRTKSYQRSALYHMMGTGDGAAFGFVVRVGSQMHRCPSDPGDWGQDRALAALEAAYRRELIERMERMTETTESAPMPHMPDEAPGFTKHFTLGDGDGYLHVAAYSNGWPGRIAITVAKAGDKDRAFLEVAGTLATMLLQRGVSLAEVMAVWRGTRFTPCGLTGEGEAGVPTATSPLDYAARFLLKRFGGDDE